MFNLAAIAMEPEVCVPDHKTNEGRITLPKPLTLSSESVAPDGLYLLDNARAMYVWISEHCPKQIIRDVFGVDKDKAEDRKKLAQHVSWCTMNGQWSRTCPSVRCVCVLPRYPSACVRLCVCVCVCPV
jgi:hypothetical protein